MGSNGIINGLTSEFKYTMQLSDKDSNATAPQSGVYNGFFWMKLTPPKRINETNIQLHFHQDGSIYRVTGSGENRLGAFSLLGTYSPATSEMVCTKLYAAAEQGGMVGGRSTRHHGEYGGEPEREYRTARLATPSFLRENVDVPPGLSEDMKMCYKSLKRLMVGIVRNDNENE